MSGWLSRLKIKNTGAAYGWMKRGQRRKLSTNFGRQRLNSHGAINIETLEMKVDADSTIELLETLNQRPTCQSVTYYFG